MCLRFTQRGDKYASRYIGSSQFTTGRLNNYTIHCITQLVAAFFGLCLLVELIVFLRLSSFREPSIIRKVSIDMRLSTAAWYFRDISMAFPALLYKALALLVMEARELSLILNSLNLVVYE